jgi:hypothetical protein
MVNYKTPKMIVWGCLLLGILRGGGGAFLSRLGDDAVTNTPSNPCETRQHYKLSRFFLSLLTGARLTTGTGRLVVVSLVGVQIRINIAPKEHWCYSSCYKKVYSTSAREHLTASVIERVEMCNQRLQMRNTNQSLTDVRLETRFQSGFIQNVKHRLLVPTAASISY